MNNFLEESYNLFRLEISNFLKINNTLKDKIEKILENKKINNKEKKNLLKKIIYKVASKDLYNLSAMKGGDKNSLLITDEKNNKEFI